MDKNELLDKLATYNLQIEDLKLILLEKFVDANGDINISGLDFSEFNGNIIISNMKVCNTLFQSNHIASNIFQSNHTVQGEIHQNNHKVCGMIIQSNHKVDGNIKQCRHKVSGELLFFLDRIKGGCISQKEHNVEGKILQQCHKVRGVLIQDSDEELKLIKGGKKNGN